jgi:putative SOS response-associated peptidase YedK
MCCRYHLSREHYVEILRHCGIAAPADYVSRYNIAPGRPIVAARTTARAPQGEAARLRWGLTPAWAQDDDSESRHVNARAETLRDKPSFRDALPTRRCVIPASGFFEWESAGRARRPWRFRWRDETPFGLAGIWETWRAPDGALVESCAVITTTPNAVMQPIHHRMPVMLTPDEARAWLDRRTPVADALALLRPPPAERMLATRVNPVVGSVQADGPECLAPAPDDSEPQLSLGLE